MPAPLFLSRGKTLTNTFEQVSDLELVNLTRAGDENAFAEIVRRHSKRVFSVAGRFFRRRDQIEDCAQEIFLRVYTRLGDYQARGSFEGWLTRIAVTTSLNLLRRQKGQTELNLSDFTDDESRWIESALTETASSSIPGSIENDLIAVDLTEKVLATLSPDDRLVLLLMDGEGRSVREVVEMTGWSESKVKVQAFRARRRMRAAVEKLMARPETPEGTAGRTD